MELVKDYDAKLELLISCRNILPVSEAAKKVKINHLPNAKILFRIVLYNFIIFRTKFVNFSCI